MPKLYFGSRGGMYYRKNGRRVYVKQRQPGRYNRFGSISKIYDNMDFDEFLDRVLMDAINYIQSQPDISSVKATFSPDNEDMDYIVEIRNGALGYTYIIKKNDEGAIRTLYSLINDDIYYRGPEGLWEDIIRKFNNLRIRHIINFPDIGTATLYS